jgi:hypothetical protein
VPDAPVSLQNEPSETNALQITFTWLDGASNGGTAVIDYKILFALEGQPLTELATGVGEQKYTTTETLTAGSNYDF